LIHRSLSSAAFALILGVSSTSIALSQTAEEDSTRYAPGTTRSGAPGAAIGAGLEPPKGAGQKQETQKQETPKQETPKQETPGEEPKSDPKIEEYEKAIKDLKRIEGPFPLYLRRKEILLELSEERLGKLFMMQAALSSGVASMYLQAGDPLGGAFEVGAYRFDRQEDQVHLVRPNLRYRWDASDPLALAASRSFPEAILAGFRIEQTHPEKKLLLVNVSPLFGGEVLRLQETVNSALTGQYMLDQQKSGVERVKGFPENTVVQMRLHYFSPRGAEQNPLLALLGLGNPSHLEDSRSAPLKVTYNLWYRKGDEYRPRLSDPRVGYFTQDFYTLNRFLQQDRTERFIMRFRLEKKDPSAPMSEPVKPIVWTLDPSIPEQYRAAVREGVLRWNRAFEAIGYKNAVVVQDPPKDDPDYDHADGRYNVIRWTMSPDAGYAIALFRTDPFTGEILNASVTFDANMLAFAMNEHKNVVTPSASVKRRLNDVLLRSDERTEDDDAFLWSTDRQRAERELASRLQQHGWNGHRCTYSEGLADSSAFAMQGIVAGAHLSVSREEYAKQFIADVISHEIGHCLGLRHNFVASTHLSTTQLADDSLTSDVGISASVMDYNPVNVMAVLRGKGNFYMTTVGPYDKWAIKYGYTEIPADGPTAERHVLHQIASRSTEPGLAYMTDENADNWDPFVVRFDAAQDPVQYASKMIDASRRIRKYAIEQLPRPGENYAQRTSFIMSSISQTFRQGRVAARFVGGIQARRDYRGDKNVATLSPVDAQVQRDAIRLIVRNIFSEDSFDLPAEVLLSLSQDPNAPMAAGWTAPVRDLISLQQSMLLAGLLSANTTDRITENAFKLRGRNAYTLDEHFGILLANIFSEVGQNRNVSGNRRDLQRYALNVLMLQANAPSGSIGEDARTLASDALRRLEKRFSGQAEQSKQLDGMTQAHLRDSRDSISRFVARHVTTNR
jgi:hypothetical protein